MIKQDALTKELAEMDKRHFIHPTSSIQEQQANGPAIIFKEGKGVHVTDINGETYIEGMASLWNVNVGYGRKELAEAAKKQLETLAFSSSFATFSNEPAIRLAAKIASITPGDLHAVFFTSGGSESNDTAYKLVRHYWKLKGQPHKTKIISQEKAYHGVAIGSTSATGIQDFQQMATSLAPGFLHTEPFSAEALRKTIEQEGADTIAAFIAEPVQGAGGVNIPPDGYFQEVREICNEHNILLIADEVITGFGRTGKLFACEHWGITPDMMLLAKGISSGYIPLGAVVLREHLHRDLIRYSEGTLLHGFTYSGHPTACTVALKNIEIIENEQLADNSKRMGDLLLQELTALQTETNILGDIRVLGLIGAVDIVKNKETSEGFPQKISPVIIAEARRRGLILRTVTFGDADTIVFSPPLVINEEEVHRMVAILKESILAVQSTL
ncbi:aminotransferase family protein [Bacillus xiapuensis]|uniref:aminotransferase family protein n=1 Tax=Bacillus xiapuensis TaxID=2014075 RepID=UPI000C245CB7|nr:aspartate aminotransferase family protein [Bacillus xiapuensis]